MTSTKDTANGPAATILQFGIGRFLLAHVDLFASQARDEHGGEIRIIALQTSDRAAGRTKAHALARDPVYPVRMRGRRDGELIDTTHQVDSITTALVASEAWAEVERRFRDEVTHVVSNTSEAGYQVPAGDGPLRDCPESFPAKLTHLLKTRFDSGRPGVTLLPCELLTDNALKLKDVILKLAQAHYDDDGFMAWLERDCVWAVTLVDRIVSAELDPVGAVAEPYGLWAIQRTPGLTLPFTHPDVQLVDDIRPFERRKLHLLNLAHTWLVARVMDLGLGEEVTLVRQAIDDPRLGDELEAMLRQEVVPVLDQELPGMGLEDYVDSILDRFRNPWLDHRLADIAQNHPHKLERRLAPVVQMAAHQGRQVPRLASALPSTAATSLDTTSRMPWTD